MNTVPLGEVTEPVDTWNPAREPETEFTYIDLSAVDNTQKAIATPVSLAGKEAPSRARQLVKIGDVLVSTVRPNLNAVALVRPGLNGATASTGFTVLRPTDRVDAKYLFHWVRTPQFVSDMVRKSTGASYPAVSDRIVKHSLIPLPPLAEQRRIAAILDQADAVRESSNRMNDYLNELNRSSYHQQFGNPLVDSSLRCEVSTVCEVITGNTPSRSDPENYGGALEWIKSDNLGDTFITPAEECLSKAGRSKARIAPAGSVLVTCIAGSPASIGKCSIADRDVAFNQQINAAVPGPEIDGRFLLEQLKVAPELVRRASTGGMKGLVSKSSFSSIQVQIPPLEQQREFVKAAEKIDSMRNQRASVLSDLDELFASLQSRAFSGQL